MKKTGVLSIALVLCAFVLLGIATITRVSAQTPDSAEPVQVETQKRGWGFDAFIQKIAETFGLNQTDVEAVFEQVRDEKKAQREELHEERLNTAVQNGDITEEQKDLILQKKIENQQKWDEYKEQDLSREDWRALKNQHRNEMKEWAEQNGIDPTYLMGSKGGLNHEGKNKMG